MKQVALLLCCLPLPVMASVDARPDFSASIEVTDFGLYQLVDRKRRNFKAQSTAGYSSVINTRHLLSTQHVPLKKGQVFGFNFAIDDPALNSEWVMVEMQIEHPQAENYLGQVSSGFKKMTAARMHTDGRYHNGAFYILSEPYELIPGEWRIQVIYKDRIVAAKRFWVEEAAD